MEQSAVERLKGKSPEEAIIERIRGDFHLSEFMARTQFEQMRGYFEEYLGLEREVGQMTFLAVSADTPPGRPIADCRREAVNLANHGVHWCPGVIKDAANPGGRLAQQSGHQPHPGKQPGLRRAVWPAVKVLRLLPWRDAVRRRHGRLSFQLARRPRLLADDLYHDRA